MTYKIPLTPNLPAWLIPYRNDNWLLAACWVLNESPSLVEYKHNNGIIDKFQLVNEYVKNRNKAKGPISMNYYTCLLYTSDAADE